MGLEKKDFAVLYEVMARMSGVGREAHAPVGG
jgi:hypothetical protein